jgi:hypothetical protein
MQRRSILWRDVGEVAWSERRGYADGISESAEFHDADAKFPGVSFRGQTPAIAPVNRVLEAAYL